MKILNAILISSIFFSQVNCAQRAQRDNQEDCCRCSSKLCNGILCCLLLCYCPNYLDNVRCKVQLEDCEKDVNYIQKKYQDNYCAICPRSLKVCHQFRQQCEEERQRLQNDLDWLKYDLKKVNDKKEKLKKD